MSIFYSASTSGFYDSDIHASMPGDVVPITDDRHAELLAGQSQGKRIAPGTGGEPVLLDPPAPTEEQVIKAYTDAMDDLFDAKAAEKNYDNRITCSLRAGYPGPFQAEGLAFAQWMDECNALGYQILADVKSGTTPQPTVEAFIAMLPSFDWPA